MIKYILYIPLFLLLLIFYNVMVLLFGINFGTDAPSLFGVTLPSGAVWELTWGYLFVLFGVGISYLEILKSTKTGTLTVVEHGLSMVVFIIFLLEFVLVKGAGTSTFLVLTLMSLLDVIAGFTISVVAARRDISMG